MSEEKLHQIAELMSNISCKKSTDIDKLEKKLKEVNINIKNEDGSYRSFYEVFKLISDEYHKTEWNKTLKEEN